MSRHYNHLHLFVLKCTMCGLHFCRDIKRSDSSGNTPLHYVSLSKAPVACKLVEVLLGSEASSGWYETVIIIVIANVYSFEDKVHTRLQSSMRKEEYRASRKRYFRETYNT